MEINQDIESKILSRQWFYRFLLPSGRVTETYLAEEMQKIHDTREQMMFEVLNDQFGHRWEELKCVDLACHEGYFSHKLALKNCAEVLGIDTRPEHIEHANLIREAFNLKNLRFQIGDIQNLDPGQLGNFDVTVMFGILYHLENIVGALRLAQAITTKVCLIETQIAPNISGRIDWGSYQSKKEMMGCLAIVDESDEILSGNREANISPITLVPSLQGLLWLLKKVGFKESQVLTPPADAYEQIATGERVVIAAYNNSSR